jgi:RNA polymerase sigma-54 factor
MKQNLQLRLSQNLALTPQLQQSIHLLQLSTLELNQELELILQENPLLELVEGDEADDASTVETPERADAADEIANEAEPGGLTDFDDEASLQPAADVPEETPLSSEEFSTEEFNEDYDEYDASSWEGSRQPDEDEDGEFGGQEGTSISLREYLLGQLKLMQLSERDQNMVLLLIDSLNDDGYLEILLEELAESLPLDLEVDLLELETALKHLQHLDPAGVGARNLQECLLLQLNALEPETNYLGQAKAIVTSHLTLLANKDFLKLRKLLNCDEATLKGAQQLIRQQNPRPGSDFAKLGSDHFIQHEVVVRKVKGIWIASLNDGVIPKLRINQMYADILRRNRESSSQYLQSQMQEAKWMIKNIQQRFSTILRVSQAIVDRQRNFFEHGEIAMRPLVLREIADELELHESTISRVTTHKYMLTPRGVYELKYFFGSHVATDTGGACSATAIRALIKQMVAEENPKKPLSDNQITDILAKQGIVVARRTIAKYRESLNIPPANLRKSL